MHDEVMYTGSLFQVIRRKERFTVPIDDEEKHVDIEYELAKRPPGVRAIVIQNGKLLLNREFRYELNGWDYRLPGGKVFDTQKQAQVSNHKNGEEMMQYVEQALMKELWEEADLKVRNYSLYECSHNGFTVEWDLYYYIVDEFESFGKQKDCPEQQSKFEYIQPCWVDYGTVLQYCIDKKISEERSVGVLLRFLLSQITDGEEKNALFKKK